MSAIDLTHEHVLHVLEDDDFQTRRMLLGLTMNMIALNHRGSICLAEHVHQVVQDWIFEHLSRNKAAYPEKIVQMKLRRSARASIELQVVYEVQGKKKALILTKSIRDQDVAPLARYILSKRGLPENISQRILLVERLYNECTPLMDLRPFRTTSEIVT